MFNAMGQVRDSTYMKLGIGSPAQFDYWRTSTVVNIESSEGGTVETHAKAKAKAKVKPERPGERGVQRSRDVTVAADDLRAMLCSIQQIVDSAENLSGMPLEDRRLVCATSEDKERETQSLLMWSCSALNTCWNAIRTWTKKPCRVMSYLYGRTLAHHELPEERTSSVNAAKESAYCAKREARTEAGGADACMAQKRPP